MKKKDVEIKTDVKQEKVSRRKFLTASAATAAGAATLGFPSIARAAAPVSLRFQSTWPAKDIFHEYALDFAKKVNEMSDKDLKIEVLPAGSVVKAFDLLDAVSKGTLDGGHGVVAYWYGKNSAVALWGSGPAFGMDANMVLAWHYYGGGKELLDEIYKSMNMDVVSMLTGPMPTQPLGWFKKPVTKAEDIKGLKYRTVGLAADLFQEMGASVAQLPGGEIVPAMERGVIDAFEFNNPTSDRRFGAQDVAKIYMLGSYHQAMEFFEIMFNKTKFDSLPAEHQAILQYAAEAVSSSNEWKAQDYYSNDLQGLINEDGVKVIRTPQDVFDAQLKAWDVLVARMQEDDFMRRVMDSQKEWCKRVVYYSSNNAADFGAAYKHYFG